MLNPKVTGSGVWGCERVCNFDLQLGIYGAKQKTIYIRVRVWGSNLDLSFLQYTNLQK